MIPDTLTRSTRAGRLQRLFREVASEEAQWMLHGNRGPKDPNLPWMPFQPADFISIMYECVLEANGSRFFDVGCGIGTKLLLARELFGLRTYGIEIDPVMAEQARTRNGGVPIVTGDVLEMSDWLSWNYDIIWLYRPLRDPGLEAQLEAHIMENMPSGAILAGGAWEMTQSPPDWHTIVDDWEARRGAWMKP